MSRPAFLARSLASFIAGPLAFRALLLVGLSPALAGAAAVPAGPQTVQGLGTLTFPTSTASPAAQQAFIRGMLLLHLFEYEPAAKSFQAAQALDPELAMAYWGEAMTFNHPVWNQLNMDGGKAALAKYAPTAQARASRLKDPRERAWFAAVEILYENTGTKHERDLRYATAMEALSRSWPDDEAQLFFALATLGKSEGTRDVPEYLKASALARAVFERNPNHPGAAHYWIHGMDDPQHAAAALPAARALSRIAPDAGHAQHMCSHIFMALGMWPEVVEANENAMRVVDEHDRADGIPVRDCGHYAQWLEYGYLQQGRMGKADELLDRCFRTSAAYMDFRKLHPAKRPLSDAKLSENMNLDRLPMRDIAVIETQSQATSQPPSPGSPVQRKIDPTGLGFDAAWDAFALGFAAASAGDTEAGQAALQQVRTTAATNSPSSPYEQADKVYMRVMGDELAGLIAARQGHLDQAVDTVRQAAITFDHQPFDFGPPAVLKPPQELLGELLLAKGDAPEAVRAFQAALVLAPNRSLSLLGLARAQQAAGHRAAARSTWTQLLNNWSSADPGLPQVEEARRSLATK